MDSKPFQLPPAIHVQELAIFGRGNRTLQHPALVRHRDRRPASVKHMFLDGGCGGNVKDVDMTVEAHCRRGAATVAAIAGEDEELRGGEGEDFAFRGCTGVLVFTRLFAPPSYLSVQAPLTAKVGGGGTSVYCGRETTYSPVSLVAWS